MDTSTGAFLTGVNMADEPTYQEELKEYPSLRSPEYPLVPVTAALTSMEETLDSHRKDLWMQKRDL